MTRRISAELLAFERLLGLVEKPRVLDRDHRLVGEGLQQRDFLLGELADSGAAEEDRTYAPPFPQHRRIDHGLEAHDPSSSTSVLGYVRAFEVGVVHDASLEDRRSGGRRLAERYGE